jgi:hypothetical protein
VARLVAAEFRGVKFVNLEGIGAAAVVGLGGAAMLIGPSVASVPLSGHADVALRAAAGVLSDSMNAMFVGGTFEPTPSTSWVDTAETRYLDPLGFAGPDAGDTTVCDMSGTSPCDAPLQVLTTPELLEEGPSTLETEQDIIKAVEAEYAAGNMSATDPLTVFAYSQSAMAASAAEAVLAKDGIPQADLHFVFIGDPSTADGVAPNIHNDLVQLFGGGASGTSFTDSLLKFVNEDQFAPGGPLAGVTPNDLYQTTIYTIHTDGVADWQKDWDTALATNNGNAWEALGNALYHLASTHLEYLGLTPADVATGVATTDGLTTTITIPDGADPGAAINDSAAWMAAFPNGLGDSGLWSSLAESLQDIFNPAYA